MLFPGGPKMAPKMEVPKKDNETMALELNREPCGQCEGPFEFWGLSADSKAYRCTTCQVIQFVPKNQTHGASGPETIANRPTL